MATQEAKQLAIANFITKICSLERQIELKRQTLCDRNDFEPYVAFQRLLRTGSEGITSANIMKFLSENLIDVRICDARSILQHYDNDFDGLLSYKEFLEIVLPKEHPDLRAFVTQRECFDIKEEEYLSYETEAAMAIMLALEVGMIEAALGEKQELKRLKLDGRAIVEIVDAQKDGNLNFNNIQRFLHDCGLMPYDSEIINFLRRVDRDDDGVITDDELERFLSKFGREAEGPGASLRMTKGPEEVREDRLKTFSPNRKIVDHKFIMFSPEHGRVKYSSKLEAMKGDDSVNCTPLGKGSQFKQQKGSGREVLRDLSYRRFSQASNVGSTNKGGSGVTRVYQSGVKTELGAGGQDLKENQDLNKFGNFKRKSSRKSFLKDKGGFEGKEMIRHNRRASVASGKGIGGPKNQILPKPRSKASAPKMSNQKPPETLKAYHQTQETQDLDQSTSSNPKMLLETRDAQRSYKAEEAPRASQGGLKRARNTKRSLVDPTNPKKEFQSTQPSLPSTNPAYRQRNSLHGSRALTEQHQTHQDPAELPSSLAYQRSKLRMSLGTSMHAKPRESHKNSRVGGEHPHRTHQSEAYNQSLPTSTTNSRIMNQRDLQNSQLHQNLNDSRDSRGYGGLQKHLMRPPSGLIHQRRLSKPPICQPMEPIVQEESSSREYSAGFSDLTGGQNNFDSKPSPLSRSNTTNTTEMMSTPSTTHHSQNGGKRIKKRQSLHQQGVHQDYSTTNNSSNSSNGNNLEIGTSQSQEPDFSSSSNLVDTEAYQNTRDDVELLGRDAPPGFHHLEGPQNGSEYQARKSVSSALTVKQSKKSVRRERHRPPSNYPGAFEHTTPDKHYLHHQDRMGDTQDSREPDCYQMVPVEEPQAQMMMKKKRKGASAAISHNHPHQYFNPPMGGRMNRTQLGGLENTPEHHHRGLEPENHQNPQNQRRMEREMRRRSQKQLHTPEANFMSPEEDQVGSKPPQTRQEPPKQLKLPKIEIKFKKAQNGQNQANDPQMDCFIDCLRSILEQNMKTELVKRKLALTPGFDLQGVFSLLDAKNKGSFNFEEFRMFLNSLGIQKIPAKTLIDFYSGFDVDDQRKLGFKQFEAMLAPFNTSTAALEEFGAELGAGGEQVEEVLVLAFRTLLEAKTALDMKKKEMGELGVEVNQIYDDIDENQTEELRAEEFFSLFKRNGVEYSESGLAEMGVFLRDCDIDRDGVISFKDFYLYFSL